MHSVNKAHMRKVPKVKSTVTPPMHQPPHAHLHGEVSDQVHHQGAFPNHCGHATGASARFSCIRHTIARHYIAQEQELEFRQI